LHTIAASCHRPQLKPDAAHNWAFLRGPGLVCGVSTAVLAVGRDSCCHAGWCVRRHRWSRDRLRGRPGRRRLCRSVRTAPVAGERV